jgi:hypothetical protein
MCFLKHIMNESSEVTTRSAVGSAVGSAVRMVVGSAVRGPAIHGWVAGSRRDMLVITIETLVQGINAKNPRHCRFSIVPPPITCI